MSDYADRWAERERFTATLHGDDKYAYTTGLAHAYADVFDTFQEAFGGAMPCTVHAVFERLSAQWDDVRATQTVRGAL